MPHPGCIAMFQALYPETGCIATFQALYPETICTGWLLLFHVAGKNKIKRQASLLHTSLPHPGHTTSWSKKPTTVLQAQKAGWRTPGIICTKTATLRQQHVMGWQCIATANTSWLLLFPLIAGKKLQSKEKSTHRARTPLMKIAIKNNQPAAVLPGGNAL